MKSSPIRRVGLVAVLTGSLAASVAVCAARGNDIPALTLEAASRLPPDQLPRVFRDPDPYSYYPYNIHETDGLSRNPDDCLRWGCIDHR
jgi:hypothetical protein